MKKTQWQIVLTVLSGILCACESNKSQTHRNVQQNIETSAPVINNARDTDSILIANYFAWQESIEYINAYNYDSEVLSRSEKNRDSLFLQAFINENYDQVKLYDGFPYAPHELIPYLYAIDLNGDTLPDIFYQGPTGAEPDITQIFLNTGTGYTKIFAREQRIMDMQFSDNQLKSFVLINPGCCADPQIVEYYYSVSYRESKPTFTLTNTSGYVSWTEAVKSRFRKPTEFTIQQNQTKLRGDSYILDGIENPMYGGNGNILATYSKGAKGVAIGNKIENNEEWLYVRMSAASKPDSCEFHTFIEQATELYGWLIKSQTDLR